MYLNRSHDVEGTGQHLCNHDPRVNVKSEKAGICNGVPLTAVLFLLLLMLFAKSFQNFFFFQKIVLGANGSDQDQDQHSVNPNLGPLTVCKSFQQTTKLQLVRPFKMHKILPFPENQKKILGFTSKLR